MESNKRKTETQIDFEKWLNDNHNTEELEIDMEDVETFFNIHHGKGNEILQKDANKIKTETQIDFEKWLNDNHNDEELEIDMEDVETFFNIHHGKGSEILQRGANKRKTETQINFDNNKRMKLQDCNDHKVHNTEELEIDMEDVENFFNIQHGKGNEILQGDEFTCAQCNKKYKELKNLNKHIKHVHEEKRLNCNNCSYATNVVANMKRHVISCERRSKKELENSAKLKLNMNPPQDDVADNMDEASAQDESITTEKSAFNKLLKEKTWYVRGFQDLIGALQEYKSRIKHAASISLKREGPHKIEIVSQVRYYKEDKDGNRVSMSAYHNSNVNPYLRLQDFDDIYQSSVAKIWDTFDAFQKTGSGWILERIKKIILKMYKYQPLSASSYIPTPPAIANKHAIINVQNKEDHSCFE